MRLTTALLLLLCAAPVALAQMQSCISLKKLNAGLSGRIEDFTRNHGRDNRIWSEILGQRRDLYVYLPPGYDPAARYPLVLWLHGGFGDEHSFLDTANIPGLDRLIAAGRVPPMVVACPDGSYTGRNLVTSRHSLYANGCGGRVEDHVMQEVVPFLTRRYSVAPGRECHGVAGVSAGGTGAMSLALKHRDFFGAAASASGALNLRYGHRSGDYFAPFSPDAFCWKTSYDPREVVGKFAGGLVRIHAGSFVRPVFGGGPDVVERIKCWNPADLLAATDLGPGQLRLYVRYGGADNLNLDAQGASFAWLARGRGAAVEEVCVPGGKHDAAFFRESSVSMYQWLGEQFAGAVTPAAPAAPASSR